MAMEVVVTVARTSERKRKEEADLVQDQEIEEEGGVGLGPVKGRDAVGQDQEREEGGGVDQIQENEEGGVDPIQESEEDQSHCEEIEVDLEVQEEGGQCHLTEVMKLYVVAPMV